MVMHTFATLAVVLVSGMSSMASAEEMKMSMPQGADMNQQRSEPKVDGGFSEALKQSMAKMMSDMDVKSTDNPDADFVTLMLPHHQSAVDMAKIELRYGKDPVLREMAQKIVISQDGEIATMRDWQSKYHR